MSTIDNNNNNKHTLKGRQNNIAINRRTFTFHEMNLHSAVVTIFIRHSFIYNLWFVFISMFSFFSIWTSIYRTIWLMIERACSLITIFAVQKYINDTNNPIAEQMINDAPEQKLKTDRLFGHFATFFSVSA